MLNVVDDDEREFKFFQLSLVFTILINYINNNDNKFFIVKEN